MYLCCKMLYPHPLHIFQKWLSSSQTELQVQVFTCISLEQINSWIRILQRSEAWYLKSQAYMKIPSVFSQRKYSFFFIFWNKLQKLRIYELDEILNSISNKNYARPDPWIITPLTLSKQNELETIQRNIEIQFIRSKKYFHGKMHFDAHKCLNWEL